MDFQIHQPTQSTNPTRTRSIGAPTTAEKDSYLSRLLKLIPTETIALYMFIDGIVKSGLQDDPSLQVWLWIIFGIILILNILYLKRVKQIHHIPQLFYLTLAYVIWVFTFGGPFEFQPWYREFMASILLALYTFTIPIVYTGDSVNQEQELEQ
ncbi:hypothetical protein [Flavilitoribacter nigricans]|uniref:Uncharacterized protein n=1 Tax=Flavilitoribacter nigricans (strain ATCC 23147 / DSM 23189 / NBRC 102662 / NCIMB 1420 / SS-2) TaxID=1122177 RepID=A0A2D0MY73_FLAN2|nr:hypothetical protein [Flavilitoribacter nigricans]PHN01214.1 hypothetical protein CRP01_38385 [Flavilitoribacter nigricans DSM 23189 = NBRC 102662]